MRATHLLALALVKHAEAPADAHSFALLSNPLITGMGGAGIGALINAIRGKNAGRGALTGGITGLGVTAGNLAGGLSGAQIGGQAGGDAESALTGGRVGAPVGAGLGGLLGYLAARDTSEEDDKKKDTVSKTAAEVPFYEDPSNIGAAAGAAIGGSGAALLSKKNKWRNALIAALAGGAAGYVAGPHVDKAVPQIREGLGALSGAGARAFGKQSAASRADFDGNAVGTSPDFLEALGAKMAPSSATAPRRTPAPVVKPKMKPVQVTGQKTAQDAAPATPFYKDPANIGAVTGAALAGGGAALLSKKNKWRNALLAALAGGAAGYVAGPHVDKAVPQIREGLGAIGDKLSPATKPVVPPKATPEVAAKTPEAPASATPPNMDFSELGTMAPPKFDV